MASQSFQISDSWKQSLTTLPHRQFHKDNCQTTCARPEKNPIRRSQLRKTSYSPQISRTPANGYHPTPTEQRESAAILKMLRIPHRMLGCGEILTWIFQMVVQLRLWRWFGVDENPALEEEYERMELFFAPSSSLQLRKEDDVSLFFGLSLSLLGFFFSYCGMMMLGMLEMMILCL